ncbi:type II toxin-antitoxin system Phd/YefM family antitoxin [Hydrogenimonas sp. SS33]|uniref:type II toxin-antitoxin system Phd/YefM family antitoxin n=1 Tax=Hydrogenimonas leucolamina TaxID=2954236 RepID=UPI00336BDE43
MKVVNYTNARNHLRRLIDEVVDGDEEVVITTKDDKTVVMIPFERYNLSWKQIKEDIAQSMRQIEEGELVSVDEAFEEAMRACRK